MPSRALDFRSSEITRLAEGRTLRELLGERGVQVSYHSAFGHDVDVPEFTLRRLAAHLLHTERRRRPGAAPPRVPQPAPHLPEAPTGWGWAIQLYAARSRRSWGIGDLTDLAAFAARFAGQAAAVIVNPLHAGRPGPHQQPSPYSPASRLWLNLLFVDPEQVPGAEQVDLADLAERGRALNGQRRIDRDAVWAVKLAALERIWRAGKGRPGAEFEAWAKRHSEALHSFAVWSTLAERHEGPWWSWPRRFRHPASPHVAAFAERNRNRVRFWAWCQWVADRQLAAACNSGVDIVFDLALGFDAGGADAWRWQDLLAFDFEVGCPPDPRNPDGQCWGLPPFDPGALAASDYAPFRETVRAAFRHAAGVRVDHVMGLWRQFWVPRGQSPALGAYLRYPGDELLAVLRSEAAAAGAWVVGEDMGTVEDRVREDMAGCGMLGYRVAMRTDPDTWPAHVVGGVATHDQATVAGTLDGSDTRALLAAGRSADLIRLEALRRRVAERAGLDPDAPVDRAGVEAAIVAMHTWVAQSPARLVVATLDDAAGVAERPNIPGTIDQWPNWRIALPGPVEDILDSSLARRLVEVFAAHRGRRKSGSAAA
jgi:4-alpha-glucanotransferase